MEEARALLYQGELDPREQTKLACAYAKTLGQAPVDMALQCIDEMFGCFTVVLNDQNAAACSSHAFLISNLRRPDEWTLIRRRTLLIESKIQILTFLSEFNLLLICVICSDCVICSERLSKQH